VRAASEAMLMGVQRVEIRILVGKSGVSGGKWVAIGSHTCNGL